jgi:hypothetical protein
MTWDTEIELSRGVRKVSITQDGRQLSYTDVIESWANDSSFTRYFTSILKSSPFEAYFWETPPVNAETLNHAFEFVEVEGEILKQMPTNRQTFLERFNQAKNHSIISFANLGGDAQLVVPCPLSASSEYPHLAEFLRTAPDEQIEALWQQVGLQAEKTISDKNTWISTAGAGVAWLHVRFDSFPKYYSYAPYRGGE